MQIGKTLRGCGLKAKELNRHDAKNARRRELDEAGKFAGAVEFRLAKGRVDVIF